MALYPLAISSNISSDTATDLEFYNPGGASPISVKSATCTFRIAATGSSPRIEIRTASGGLGDGLTLALDAAKNRGYIAGDLVIPANNSIWLRFTDCSYLGDGAVTLDMAPTTVALPGVTDDELTGMLQVYLGREITSKELNYFKRNARKKIMNTGDLLGMQKSATFNITSGTESYNISSIASDFKSPASLYIDENSTTRIHLERVYDRDTFNRAMLLDGEQAGNSGYPAIYMVWADKIWLSPVRKNATVNIDYYYYLSDVSGAGSDYFNTHFPQSIELLVQSNAERMKPDGNIEKAMALEQWALKEITKAIHGDTSRIYSGGGLSGIKRG